MMGTVLYGDMIIAHQLIAALGEKRSSQLLVFLEQDGSGDSGPEPADRAAFMAFLQELELHFGPDLPALKQLRSLDQLRM